MNFIYLQLSPSECWMVKQNIQYAKEEGLEKVVARLEAGGYLKVAEAVRQLFVGEAEE